MGELLLIFLVVLLVFGAKRIPEIARGLGHGIREFREATREITRELNMSDGSRTAARPDIRPPATSSAQPHRETGATANAPTPATQPPAASDELPAV